MKRHFVSGAFVLFCCVLPVQAGMFDAARRAMVEEVKAELEPEIRADHPTWDAPEWIGFAIECFYAEIHG